jgi:hypothetical protein
MVLWKFKWWFLLTGSPFYYPELQSTCLSKIPNPESRRRLTSQHAIASLFSLQSIHLSTTFIILHSTSPLHNLRSLYRSLPNQLRCQASILVESPYVNSDPHPRKTSPPLLLAIANRLCLPPCKL